ncbi:hypothetical protein [Polaromonas sp.]|uniref:hypothetical protein n=1 Tax=Polaromonas sp. TaxID=1869339 RepID=UPI00352BD096
MLEQLGERVGTDPKGKLRISRIDGLVAAEKGKPASNESTIRADVLAAYERRLEKERAGDLGSTHQGIANLFPTAAPMRGRRVSQE